MTALPRVVIQKTDVIHMKTLPPLTVGTINYRNVLTPVLNTEKLHRNNLEAKHYEKEVEAG